MLALLALLSAISGYMVFYRQPVAAGEAPRGPSPPLLPFDFGLYHHRYSDGNAAAISTTVPLARQIKEDGLQKEDRRRVEEIPHKRDRRGTELPIRRAAASSDENVHEENVGHAGNPYLAGGTVISRRTGGTNDDAAELTMEGGATAPGNSSR